MTIRVLAEKGQNHCEIDRALGVTEGAVRYHLRRAAEGAADWRQDKPFQAEAVVDVIATWQAERMEAKQPVNVRELSEHLVAEYAYPGYHSVLRYVRTRFPTPRMRTYRRVETPPGAHTQTDWG